MKKILFFIVLAISTNSFALNQNIIIDGSIPSQVTLHSKTHNLMSADISGNIQQTPSTKNNILLLHITLSPRAKFNLATQAEKQLNHPTLSSANPTKVALGMNGVPVFDQGRHGTCATFATTAAVDAAYGKGDYISQLCNLELGSYLQQLDASYPSGWDGSLNQIILDQMDRYGVISMTSQLFKGCSGVHFYPLYDEKDIGFPMPSDEFTLRSEKILSSISSKPVLKMSDAMSSSMNGDTLLADVKKALQAGNRVIIGTLLDQYQGQAGAEGKYKYSYDSWILTPAIERDARNGMIDAGHALVITGFDDNAVITGPGNTKHRGVLTLRNSWSFMAGDYGDYYMSYSYFETFVIEAIEISPKKNA